MSPATSSTPTATVCSRITPTSLGHLYPLMAHRASQPEARYSGWFIGCCDHRHDHDNPNELTTVHLLHLVEHYPPLFPYLALPVGFQLLFEQDKAIIFHPNQENGYADPATLLTSLPQL